MRTVHCSGRRGEGVGCLPRGCLPTGGMEVRGVSTPGPKCRTLPPWTGWQTGKNITFPQLRLRTVIKCLLIDLDEMPKLRSLLSSVPFENNVLTNCIVKVHLQLNIDLYSRLFETRPDAKELFVPFKHLSSEDMKHSTHLRAHALRVMGTVEKCLARIEEPEKLDELTSYARKETLRLQCEVWIRWCK